MDSLTPKQTMITADSTFLAHQEIKTSNPTQQQRNNFTHPFPSYVSNGRKHTLMGEVGALPLCILGGMSSTVVARDFASERSRGRWALSTSLGDSWSKLVFHTSTCTARHICWTLKDSGISTLTNLCCMPKHADRSEPVMDALLWLKRQMRCLRSMTRLTKNPTHSKTDKAGRESSGICTMHFMYLCWTLTGRFFLVS